MVFLFFHFYNRFALDANLQNLKTSLAIMDKAAGVGQAETALLLVDQALITEMSKPNVNLKNLAALQYAQGALAGGERQRPIEDAEVMVASMAEDAAAGRNNILATADGIATSVQNIFKRLALLPKQIGNDSSSRKINEAQLKQASQWEQQGQFKEALAAYQELLDDYPNYAGRTTLLLRMGHLEQQLHELDKAAEFYRKAAGESQTLNDSQAAQQLLLNLDRIRNEEFASKQLQQKLSALGPGAERQETAFELGSLLIGLSRLEEAARAFRQAREAEPGGELVLAATFKEGWCYRMSGRFDDAFDRFREIIQKDPKGPWGAASYHQIAEAYKATGDYDSAIKAYELILAQAQDSAFSAIVHAQAGSTYRYDLKKPVEAAAYMRELPIKFPASPISNMGRQIEQREAAKALFVAGPDGAQAGTPGTPGGVKTPTGTVTVPEKPESGMVQLAEGSPVMSWLEGFLPIFVDVFAERLARYMEVVGEHELKRKFTEQEFKELIVRRIQQRYAGQITDVDTKIRPEGFIGTGKVRLGILQFDILANIGIVPKDDRIHVDIHEVKVGLISIPTPLLKILEARVNMSLDRAQYPIKITAYDMREGYAYIAVELIKKSSTVQPRDQVLF